MARVHFVYPNVTELKQRGGLIERWERARNARCDIVEVPADLIKNKTEVERTGQDVGAFLTQSSIELLYQRDRPVPADLKYSLHTDPSIPRNDRHGRRIVPPLRWHDPAWVSAYADMLLGLSDYLGTSPHAVEIYSGDRKNTVADIVRAIAVLSGAYLDALGSSPIFLLVNRAEQAVFSETQLRSFWLHLTDHCPDIETFAGVALDIRQFRIAKGDESTAAFARIFPESLKGFHMPAGPREPGNESTFWDSVSATMLSLRHEFFVKPDVIQQSRVEDGVRFAAGMLRRAGRELPPA